MDYRLWDSFRYIPLVNYEQKLFFQFSFTDASHKEIFGAPILRAARQHQLR